MHDWSEKDVDWAGISEAAEYIGLGLRKWGRMEVRDYKEKYGTVRVYCSFGWQSLHSVTHPGWAYIQYKRNSLLWFLEWNRVVRKCIQSLNCLVIPFHVWLYRKFYRNAIRKWPHLRLEILSGADYSKLLSEHGVHHIRTSSNSYEIRYDWHKDSCTKPVVTTVEDDRIDGMNDSEDTI